MDLLFPKPEYRALRLPSTPDAEAASCQCTGDRDEQQDACGVFVHGNALLAVVADGMGGLARGGAAAQVAVDSAGRQAPALLAGDITFDTMKAALARVNADVYEGVAACGVMGMAGTTLAAAVVRDGQLRLIWSGDSRVYLWRRGKLSMLTEDHVYARYLAEMVAEGVITEADARMHPGRDYLTGYVGMRSLEDYSITPGALALEAGDGLLLCTDGLYKCLDDAELRRCMVPGAAAAATALIRGVVRKRLPGQDNATALVMKWTKQGISG
jgi:serine/threonine protein phosphatase PrpC